MKLDFDTLYIDLDHTLVESNDNYKVDIDLVRILYWCLNEEKKIVLLTKHLDDSPWGDLMGLLMEKKLDFLFHEIIHLTKGEHKYEYIKGNSIVIDDSVKEREELEVHGIRVFLPSEIKMYIPLNDLSSKISLSISSKVGLS